MLNKNFFFFIFCIIFVCFILYLNQKNKVINVEPSVLKHDTNNISIFCFIKTYPDHFDTFLKTSFKNCFKHCTDYRFVTIYDKRTDNMPYKFLHPSNWYKESYKNLTNKMYYGLLDTKKLPSYDWYLIADDDSFVHLENLFLFLQDKDLNRPIAFGHHFNPGFLSGGASFVFSKSAHNKLVNKLTNDFKSCPNSGRGIDDLDLSFCLKKAGVEIGDSRDEYGLERFHPNDFDMHFFGPVEVGMSVHKQNMGKECCSKKWISFHEKNYHHFDRMIELVDDILE